MRSPNRGIWTDNEAEAWNLSVPREQTAREIGFLLWAFRRFGGGRVREVLDLGCGTGRLALELAARGYAVTGVDRSPAMLKRARLNADERHLKLDLFQTPLDELAIDGRFDAAYSIQDPFNYLLKEEDLSRALARVRLLVRPRGLLIVDMINFAALYGVWRRVLTRDSSGEGWSVRRRVVHTIDDVNMLWYHRVTTVMEREGKRRRWSETHVLRMWTYPEFKRQLVANGFADVRLFGQLEAGAKEATTTAPRLEIVAK